MKYKILILALLLGSFSYSQKITSQEKQALKQFISFCKIQIDIEDPRYQYSTGYTYMILSALNQKDYVIKKKDVKDKLDEVLADKDLQNTFLSTFAKISGYNKTNLYFIVRPNDNRYLSKVSPKDAEILTNYILNNYKHIEETPKEAEKGIKSEEPIKYIKVEKEAVFKGGDEKLQEYIFQDLNIPESAQDFSGKVNVNFVIMEDGSIDNISIKPNVPIELQTEIERVFKNMPKWTPAKSQGKNIKMKKSFPLIFR